MITCFIFDIDGTILDTEKVVMKALRSVLTEEGIEYSEDQLRSVMAFPGKETLKRLHVKDVDRVHDRWIQAEIGLMHEVRIFPGMERVIRQLKAHNLKLGIVTSRTKEEVEGGFSLFGLNHYFDCILTVSDTKNHKPHPEPLLKCMAMLDANPRQTLYIGDSHNDMKCAKNARAKFGLAYWGAKTTEGFEVDYLFKRPEDILSVL